MLVGCCAEARLEDIEGSGVTLTDSSELSAVVSNNEHEQRVGVDAVPDERSFPPAPF